MFDQCWSWRSYQLYGERKGCSPSTHGTMGSCEPIATVGRTGHGEVGFTTTHGHLRKRFHQWWQAKMAGISGWIHGSARLAAGIMITWSLYTRLATYKLCIFLILKVSLSSVLQWKQGCSGSLCMLEHHLIRVWNSELQKSMIFHSLGFPNYWLG